MAVRLLMATILTYSPRKLETKTEEPASVKNPATSSDSASDRSKGARDSSQVAQIIKIRKIGHIGIIFQIAC